MISINTRFKFAVFSVFFIVVAFGGLIYSQVRNLSIYNERMRSAGTIYASLTSSRGLLLDYLRYHLDRPRIQWEKESKTLSQFVEIKGNFDSDDDKFISRIKASILTRDLIFKNLIKNYEDAKQDFDSDAKAHNLEGIITGELMVVLQNSITESHALISSYNKVSTDLIGEVEFEIQFSMIMLLSIILYSYFYFNATLIRPLGKLKDSISAMMSGDLNSRLNIEVHDELGDVAKLFNDMADNLQKSYENLERNVEDKTTELNKKLSELEKMNTFMVDREMRMVELKKKIAELEKQGK